MPARPYALTLHGVPDLQSGLAQMLKGGVIMDVVTPEEARIAEEAGAVAVMALERVPADIRKDGGVARMSDPDVRAGRVWGQGGKGGGCCCGRARRTDAETAWK